MTLANISIRNNVFRSSERGIYITAENAAGDVDNIDIINNSIYNCDLNGISIANIVGAVINTKILNNIIHGNGSGTGMFIDTFNSGVLDYNNVYDCSTAYNVTGSISPGGNSITSDPLFVSATDLKLGRESPCVDAGIGNGTYSQVPTNDYRDQARPIDSELYDNADDGTDMGAFEMLASEVEPITYFVNANGSSTFPYDTKAKGAANFYTLFDNITEQVGDIIEVTDDAEIDDSGDTVPYIRKSLIIRSYSENTNNPTIKAKNDTPQFNLNALAGTISGITIQNLKIYKDGPSSDESMIKIMNGTFENLEISGCEFWIVDDSDLDSNKPVMIEALTNSPIISGNSLFENNIFHNCYYGMRLGEITGLTIRKNYIYDMQNTFLYIRDVDISNLHILKNIIINNDDEFLRIWNADRDINNLSIINNSILQTPNQQGNGVRCIYFKMSGTGSIDGLEIINNSILNSANYDTVIYIKSEVAVTNSNIVNNIIKGEAGEAFDGVYLENFTAANCIVNGNCIYGYFKQYKISGGDISVPGIYDLNVDPKFMSNTNLNLQETSPCLDKGAGSGSLASVPSDDINDVSRPVDLLRISNLDNGTDMGAYESDTDTISSYLDTGRDINVGSGDVSSNSVLDESTIESYSSVSGNPAFDSSSKWKKAIVFYEHSNGQKVRFIHEYRSGNQWKAIAIFLDSISAGTLEKKRIILLDKTGNKMGVERTEIGTLEDLTVTN